MTQLVAFIMPNKRAQEIPSLAILQASTGIHFIPVGRSVAPFPWSPQLDLGIPGLSWVHTSC